MSEGATRRLHRSRTERVVLGVCGGLADYYGVDPTVVRLIAVLLAWVTSGAAIIAYIVMGLVVPEEPLPADADAGAETPATGGSVQRGRSPWVAAEGKEAAMAQDTTGATTPTPENAGPGGAMQAPPAPPQSPPPVMPPPTPPQPGWQEPRQRGRGGLWAGVILIVLGLLFFVQEFVPGINIGQFWPLLLIVIGLLIIFNRR